MRVTAKNFLWLLPLLVAGCTSHKAAPPAQPTQTLAPPIVDTPPPPPEKVSTADLPPPVLGNPEPPKTDTAPTSPAAC